MLDKKRFRLDLRVTTLALGGMLLLGLGMSGCGGDAASGTYQISGTIDYAGTPIPAGSVMFVPDEEQGNKGPSGLATITDGQYTTADGRGVVGGKYILRISGNDGIVTESADSDEGKTITQAKDLFPPNSEIKVEIPKGEKTFDIKVPTITAGAAAGGGGGAPPPNYRRNN
jgi:roadblock/LC7 domain-containing protein